MREGERQRQGEREREGGGYRGQAKRQTGNHTFKHAGLEEITVL